MSKLYKLTDEQHETYGHTKWGEGVTHTANGVGPLCSAAWIHAYKHPLVALLMNPVHANFRNPVLWEAEGEIGISDGAKVGCRSLTTVRIIESPHIQTEQRIKFAMEVHKYEPFLQWAQSWLSGSDRSTSAAEAAAWAAGAVAEAARAAAIDLGTIAEIAIC